MSTSLQLGVNAFAVSYILVTTYKRTFPTLALTTALKKIFKATFTDLKYKVYG